MDTAGKADDNKDVEDIVDMVDDILAAVDSHKLGEVAAAVGVQIVDYQVDTADMELGLVASSMPVRVVVRQDGVHLDAADQDVEVIHARETYVVVHHDLVECVEGVLVA